MLKTQICVTRPQCVNLKFEAGCCSETFERINLNTRLQRPLLLVNFMEDIFNWGRPDVFLFGYSRIRSVKTQLIYCQITSMTTCFDSVIIWSIFNYISLVTLNSSAHFWDPKMFTAIRGCRYKCGSIL